MMFDRPMFDGLVVWEMGTPPGRAVPRAFCTLNGRQVRRVCVAAEKYSRPIQLVDGGVAYAVDMEAMARELFPAFARTMRSGGN